MPRSIENDKPVVFQKDILAVLYCKLLLCFIFSLLRGRHFFQGVHFVSVALPPSRLVARYIVFSILIGAGSLRTATKNLV